MASVKNAYESKEPAVKDTRASSIVFREPTNRTRLIGPLFLLLACVLSKPAVATCHNDFSVMVSHSGQAHGYEVTVRSFHRALYHFHCGALPLLVAPRERLILTGSMFKVTARDKSGARKWIAEIPNGYPVGMIGGGGYAIIDCWEGTIGQSLHRLNEWPEVYGYQEFVVLTLKDGKRINRGNWRDFGKPLWTNGKIIITERPDFSPATMQLVATGKQRLPVWLEVRSSRAYRLYWRKRLPGFLPRQLSPCPRTIRVGKGEVRRTLELCFRGGDGKVVGPTGTRLLRRFRIRVPLFGSSVERCTPYSITDEPLSKILGSG